MKCCDWYVIKTNFYTLLYATYVEICRVYLVYFFWKHLVLSNFITWSKAKLDPVSLDKFHFDKDGCHDPWKSTWNGCPCYRPLTHPKEKANSIISVPSIIPAPPCSTTVDGSEILRENQSRLVVEISIFFQGSCTIHFVVRQIYSTKKTVCTTNTTVGTFTKYIGYSRWWIGSTYSGSTATCCEQSAKCAPMALLETTQGPIFSPTFSREGWKINNKKCFFI